MDMTRLRKIRLLTYDEPNVWENLADLRRRGNKQINTFPIDESGDDDNGDYAYQLLLCLDRKNEP